MEEWRGAAQAKREKDAGVSQSCRNYQIETGISPFGGLDHMKTMRESHKVVKTITSKLAYHHAEASTP